MDDYDISGCIGPLHPATNSAPEWPMYSYERPAWMLWNAIAGALAQKGWTEPMIKEWLQSKKARWALDGYLGEEIDALGRGFAETIATDGGASAT